MFCFMFYIFVPVMHYSCHLSEAEGGVGCPWGRFGPPSYVFTDRSKAVLLLWFIIIGFHIYNVCLLHDFVATLRLSELSSVL